MKQFEKDLKSIQDEINPSIGFVITSNIDIPSDRLAFLKAKCLINIDRYYDNEQKISLTDTGMTYFVDKAADHKKVIGNFVYTVLSAAVGSVITLLIQWLVK